MEFFIVTERNQLAGPLGKQLLKFRILTKKRAYLCLGFLMLPIFIARSFSEITTNGLGVSDVYAFLGVIIALAILNLGLKMPADA